MLVRIECYDKTGKLVKTYGVERTLKDIGHRMYDALDNGMIPVVRDAVRAATVPEETENTVEDKAGSLAEEPVKEPEQVSAFEEARKKLREALEEFKTPKVFPPVMTEDGTPLMVQWGVPDDVNFSAIGAADDVLEAQRAFMEWMDDKDEY